MAFDTFYQSDEKTWSDQKIHLPASQSQLENNFKEQSQRLVTFETFDEEMISIDEHPKERS